MKLEHQVALVTGGASGIGKAIAARLAEDGAHVVITDLQPEMGTATAAAIGCHFIEQDVREEKRWTEVIGEIERLFGRLNILVNNAGITEPPPTFGPEEQDWSVWDRVFSVNVKGVVIGCREAIPAIAKAGGGAIVNICSAGASKPLPFYMAYGASKAAVRHITRSVATYCAAKKLNIRCNSIHPGVVPTPLYDAFIKQSGKDPDAYFEQFEKDIVPTPLGRLGQPEDIAAAVAFLASGDAAFITGAKLNVDGGFLDCN